MGIRSYEAKLKRREIRDVFFQLRASASSPVPRELYEFVLRFKDNINEMRQILEPEKSSENLWAKEIWRLLELDNRQILSEIEPLINEKNFLIAATKMQLRTRINNSITLPIPMAFAGPNYAVINPKNISELIMNSLERPTANFEVNIEDVSSFPGTYSFYVFFEDKSKYTLNITIELLDIPEFPSDINKYVSPETSVGEPVSGEEIKELLSHEVTVLDSTTTEDLNKLANILYVANRFGYSKTPEANRIKRKWYTLYEEANQALEFNASAVSDLPSTDKVQLTDAVSDDEREKLQILNLPPLVLNDLINAKVDPSAITVLVNSFPRYIQLRKKSVEDFTTEDIRSLSPLGRWTIADLKLGKNYADPRTIAKVLITIARLFFERLRIGTIESDIRYCLSYYCTRFGEYLIEQHNRYHLAREFFIEAITLNRASGQHSIDFPAGLLFRSFLKTKNLPLPRRQNLVYFIKMIEYNGTDNEEIFRTAIRSILELGNQQQDITLRWFSQYEDITKNKLLGPVRTQLRISSFADLSECIYEYRKHMNGLQALFLHLYNVNSIQAIAQNMNVLREKVDDLGFLINQTNLEILGILQQAMYSLENYLQATEYTSRKSNLETAKNLLERILGFGADNYTSLWAQHLRPVSSRWILIIEEELSSMSKGNIAFIKLSLAENHISYYERPDLSLGTRVIYRIKNTGNISAKRISISFGTDCKMFQAQKSKIDLDADEEVEDYFAVDSEELQQESLKINYSGTFYDLDGKKIEFNVSEPLVVGAMESNDSLHKLTNPFQADREVDDEKMFVGRNSLLEEVSAYAINQPSGSLLMLHGQRRVGKSSLLLFLEKNIDMRSIEKRILGVKISWINYTKHKAHHLWYAIANEIKYKLRNQFGQDLALPNEALFKESYTVAFNAVLDELRHANINRLVLLWDEFDGIVNLIDQSEYEYDRLFFEYLRGLSKRKNFTLVLTGGELMPILFERWGEVFNHDRTWRIAYLSPNDGSVEKLIRNDYVSEIVSFSDEAVNFIKYSSACNPFFIQMICRDLVDNAKNNNSPHVCKLDVEEIVERLVKRNLEIKYVKHLYTPRLEPDPLDLAVIGVVAEAENENKKSKYVDRYKILSKFPNRSEDKAINKLGELVRREILDQNPSNKNEYRVKLPIFRDWFYDNSPEYELWVSELKR
ncbi:MAG TPA: ATP-binding protein [Anaerolineales bacterium]|nr:ATP-binding protein [Anaerolineales bacterium]